MKSFLAAPGVMLAARELEALDAATCQAWVDALQARGMATTTVAVAWRTLRSIARDAASIEMACLRTYYRRGRSMVCR